MVEKAFEQVNMQVYKNTPGSQSLLPWSWPWGPVSLFLYTLRFSNGSAFWKMNNIAVFCSKVISGQDLFDWLHFVADNSPLSHELCLGRAEKRQKSKRGAKKGHSRVPKGLQGLMGEAHLCFARGGHQEAIKMCLEIIRQVPRCPDPYQLLGMIYEDKQDMEKSLQVRKTNAPHKLLPFQDIVP